MSFGSYRLQVGEVVRSRSLVAVLKHGFRRLTSVFVLLMLLCWSTHNSYGAENLKCPEIGAASVPDLMGDASGGGLFVSESLVDLANEINEAVNQLQLANPNISWADLDHVLVASCCRLVARQG